jgi:hypothetical protein
LPPSDRGMLLSARNPTKNVGASRTTQCCSSETKSERPTLRSGVAFVPGTGPRTLGNSGSGVSSRRLRRRDSTCIKTVRVNQKTNAPQRVGRRFLCPEPRLRFEKQASSGRAGHKLSCDDMLKQKTLLAEGFCFSVPGTGLEPAHRHRY